MVHAPSCIFSSIDEPVSPKIQPEAELNSRRIDSLGHLSAGSPSLGRREGRRLGRPGCVWVPAFAGSQSSPKPPLRPGTCRVTRAWHPAFLRPLAWLSITRGRGGAQTQTAHLDPQALPLPSVAKPVSPTSRSSRPGLHPLPRATLLPTSGLCPRSSLPALSPLVSCLYSHACTAWQKYHLLRARPPPTQLDPCCEWSQSTPDLSC